MGCMKDLTGFRERLVARNDVDPKSNDCLCLEADLCSSTVISGGVSAMVKHSKKYLSMCVGETNGKF
jgi:hypothetical protein